MLTYPFHARMFFPSHLDTCNNRQGKSNLTSCILWSCIDKDYCGILVLDPHDEYYGRSGLGLKDHPRKENVIYYTPNSPPPGANSLRVNIELIKPHHFDGVSNWSSPQKQAMSMYFKKYGSKWIESIIMDKSLDETEKILSGRNNVSCKAQAPLNARP